MSLTATVPLHHLAQRITEQQAELAGLRKEFEKRKKQLAVLSHRKQELQKKLQKVESEIQTVSQVAQTPLAAPAPAAAATAPAPKPAAASPDGMSLPKFLVSLVQEAKRPLTVKELAQLVVQCKFPSKSKDLFGMAETRVSELLRNGILRRTAAGIVVGRAAAPVANTKASNSGPRNGSAKAEPARPVAKSASPERKLSLKEILTHVLEKSPRPLNTEELAESVLAQGYETKSKDFRNVIWVGIGNMKNVERIPGEGYRIKKGKK